ncbi:MAG: Eco57I restriction-modification methylase domain-containing protein [bacterium]
MIMGRKNKQLLYPSPAKAAIDATKIQSFVSSHARKIVTVAHVHEALSEYMPFVQRAFNKEGFAFLTEYECPKILKSGQLLLWPLEEQIPHRLVVRSVSSVAVSCERKNIVEQRRKEVSKHTGADEKAKLGQFLTPRATSDFLASLFDGRGKRECRLLDPGAGIGSLTIAFLENEKLQFSPIKITACEIDTKLHLDLAKTLEATDTEIITSDFIETAVNWLQFEPERRFTHVILNPPYKKIATSSSARNLLRCVDIETVNLYSAFVALSIKLLDDGGQLVAIIPRSFCNGPYYKSFRKLILRETAIQQIHLFDSRKSAFKDDNVLQENIVIKLEKCAKQGDVLISMSADDTFHDYHVSSFAFSEIVKPLDKEQFIHIPTSCAPCQLDQLPGLTHSLSELGVSVSTGPVVDFRVKDFLSRMPTRLTVPLLYPAHCGLNTSVWPKPDIKKSNALIIADQTKKWLFPLGYYCVVKRFSSKEEKRRISASVISPGTFGNVLGLAFENHLNVFHEEKKGISAELAYGLSVYLNTSFVDNYFRCFNGHTQVNATDLRQLFYPSREILIKLGKWAMTQEELTEERIMDWMRATCREKYMPNLRVTTIASAC